ncbi:hypothetical protein PCASD_08529 [Puccinia coronata f. sp. avenae]|uniref:Uncharacterized protein n=1 Tax=Puccinia coronata f. sp. avenae TaxID=200324 RepID=A0A2N5URK9_9BASI|nr:hypothetical protein PCASD_08529 [Puccinia coronata f. sp. avenae]
MAASDNNSDAAIRANFSGSDITKLQANGTPAELDDGNEDPAPNDENDQSNLASQSANIIPANGTNEPAANQPGPTATPLDSG